MTIILNDSNILSSTCLQVEFSRGHKFEWIIQFNLCKRFHFHVVHLFLELPDVQVGFRKGRGTKIKLPTSIGSLKKQKSSRKTSVSALLTMPKPLTMWITTNCGKFFNRWEYQTTWPASWDICMQVRKQQLELNMEQHTGPNRERSASCCILSPCLFNLYAEYTMRNAGLDEA